MNGLKKNKDDHRKSGLDIVHEDSHHDNSRSSQDLEIDVKKAKEDVELTSKNWKEFFSNDELDNAVIESKRPLKKGNKVMTS